MRCTQTGKEHNAMTEQVKLERRKKITKIILVTVTVLFIFVMLVVPLFSVMASALKEGFGFYLSLIHI